MVDPVLQRFCKMGKTDLKPNILQQRSFFFFFSLDPRLPVMIEGFGEHGIKASLLSSQNS